MRWWLVACAACSAAPREPADAPPPDLCPQITLVPVPSVPSIELVIDRSGSMVDDLGGTPRYTAMRDALVGANGVVTTRQHAVYFGASLYSGAPSCPAIASAPRAVDNHDAIAALIDGATPAGSTPTADAINSAAQRFTTQPVPFQSTPVIVIATDGGANTCDGSGNGQSDAITATTNARNKGIRTFVLGLGDIATEVHLQAMANAGAGVVPGTPDAPVYSAHDPAQLAGAFDEIVAGVLECDLALPQRVAPGAGPSGTVALNGTQLVYGSQWILIGSSTLQLLGAACAALNASPSPAVTATFPCGSVIL